MSLWGSGSQHLLLNERLFISLVGSLLRCECENDNKTKKQLDGDAPDRSG